MSNLPEQKVGKRRISNIPPSQTADNTLDKNQNNENNRDIQLTVKNGPDPQIKVSNLEQFPAPLSNEPIFSNPNSNQAPQPTINNQDINYQGQFQQVPGVNPSFVANQMYPQNPNVIIIRQVVVPPTIAYTKRYTPTSMTCPYCMKNVVSNPNSHWSNRSCELCCCLTFLFYITGCLGLLLYLCCVSCWDEDFCCYEATHRCPYCNNIIAKRVVNDCGCCSSSSGCRC